MRPCSLLSGPVPNRKSHPLVHGWVGVRFRGDAFDGTVPFDDLLEWTGLHRGTMPNRGLPADVEKLAKLLPAAVERAHAHFVERRKRFEDDVNVKLEEEYRISNG